MMATAKTHHGASPGKSARTRVRGPVQVSAIEPAKTLGAIWLDTDDESTPLNALVTVTTDTTLDASHTVVLCDATSGAITITLEAAASHTGRRYFIKKIDPTPNPVTINGPETIDGQTTKVISIQYNCAVIVSDGTEWWII
ncbi:hypothetical protein LCGC14_1548530 [marine sediment metagenome]|uniref:Uncharacterized protein n=1 Tax=marine sediment metagenome TaxID=412755 RepID=A0A0F9L708_9ZZZZ